MSMSKTQTTATVTETHDDYIVIQFDGKLHQMTWEMLAISATQADRETAAPYVGIVADACRKAGREPIAFCEQQLGDGYWQWEFRVLGRTAVTMPSTLGRSPEGLAAIKAEAIRLGYAPLMSV